MRRIALVLATASVLTFSGCSGAGTVLSTGNRDTADTVIITVVGPSNIPRVLPGASIALSATATIGGSNGTSTLNRFLWSATLLTSGTYVVNTNGGMKTCNVVDSTVGGVTSPFTTDMSIDITIDPTNEANILFTPPTTVTGPAGAIITTNYPYCVRIDATALTGSTAHPQNGAVGSVIVAVVNPAAPEQ
jgi:hypothetical protein